MGLKDMAKEINEQRKADNAAAQAGKVAAQDRAAKLEQSRQYVYATTVAIPVHWGDAKSCEPLRNAIADAGGDGWSLSSHTTVYAEKLGVNTLIHTLVFRPKAVASQAVPARPD